MDDRLQRAIQERDHLNQKVQRVRAELAASEERLAGLRQTCRDKGVDPDDLDKVIHALEQRYAAGIEVVEKQLNELKEALVPYQQVLQNI